MQADTTIASAPSTQSLICQLVRDYLGLDTDQAVVYNQNWKLPPDDRLYVVISSLGPQKQYGATSDTAVDLDGNLVETIAVNSCEFIGVDLFSSDNAKVIAAKDLVPMAFYSIPAQQMCEAYSLKMGRIPLTFVDASGLEATQMLTRFHLAFPVMRCRSNSKIVESFDKFSKPGLVLNP
jgi:hypothetical protein